jgi:hypothetical protein
LAVAGCIEGDGNSVGAEDSRDIVVEVAEFLGRQAQAGEFADRLLKDLGDIFKVDRKFATLEGCY